jgi:hypothetical protein
MGWFLLALVVAVVVFAAVHDVVARRQGRYRPPEDWEAARSVRRSRGGVGRLFRAGPKDGRPL